MNEMNLTDECVLVYLQQAADVLFTSFYLVGLMKCSFIFKTVL